MDLFGVAGIAAMVLPVVVNFLKKIPFIGKKYAPVAAFVVGAIFGVAADLLGLTPGMSLLQSFMAGVAIGGTSTGLYDLQKMLRK